MVIVLVVVVIMVVRIGFDGCQPRLHLLGATIFGQHAETNQCGGGDRTMVGDEQLGDRVTVAYQRLNERLVDAGQVGLGQHDAVGDDDLFDPFRLAPRLQWRVDRIDGSDDAIGHVVRGEQRILQQCGQHRDRVSEAGRLDNHPSKGGDLAAILADLQVAQLVDEVGADGAADTARVEDHGLLIDLSQQVMVERHFAELVDEHHGVGQQRIAQQVAEQGRLARAEEARNQREWDALAHRRSSRAGSSGSSATPPRRRATSANTAVRSLQRMAWPLGPCRMYAVSSHSSTLNV